MEKKNTVLLTVIAVATLLVAVVGATFAYFTATNSDTDNSAGTTDVNTASVAAGLVLNANTITGSNNVFYPGTKNFIGASAAGAFQDTATDAVKAKTYEISYVVTGHVSLNAAMEAEGSTVDWSLYETTAPVTTPITCTDPTTYTPDGGEAVAGSLTQSCTLDTALTSLTPVKTGSIAVGQTTEGGTVTYTGKVNTGSTKYYYLVAELHEQGADQSVDATGKTVTIAIDSIVSNGFTVVGA